jgi:hypothetical protein
LQKKSKREEKNMRKLLMMLAMGTTIAAGAQTSDEPKLEVKPSARITL